MEALLAKIEVAELRNKTMLIIMINRMLHGFCKIDSFDYICKKL